jgi:hypothetical protein
MPEKTRPITVLTEDGLNALDDATFAGLAADEERLNQALQDPATIPSGQALSIAKTKSRRKTLARQQILDNIITREVEFYNDLRGSCTAITSVQDQSSAQDTVIQGDAASVTSTRGGVDHDDASTQVDEDLTMSPPSVSRGRGVYPYPLIPPWPSSTPVS